MGASQLKEFSWDVTPSEYRGGMADGWKLTLFSTGLFLGIIGVFTYLDGWGLGLLKLCMYVYGAILVFFVANAVSFRKTKSYQLTDDGIRFQSGSKGEYHPWSDFEFFYTSCLSAKEAMLLEKERDFFMVMAKREIGKEAYHSFQGAGVKRIFLKKRTKNILFVPVYVLYAKNDVIYEEASAIISRYLEKKARYSGNRYAPSAFLISYRFK